MEVVQQTHSAMILLPYKPSPLCMTFLPPNFNVIWNLVIVSIFLPFLELTGILFWCAVYPSWISLQVLSSQLTFRSSKCQSLKQSLVYFASWNIIQPCGPVPWPQNRSIIFCGPSSKVRTFVCYSYIQVDIWKFGWSYTPNTIHVSHCSS